MPTHGIIYQAPSKGKKLAFNLLRGIGAGLIAFAAICLLAIIYLAINSTRSRKKKNKIDREAIFLYNESLLK